MLDPFADSLDPAPVRWEADGPAFGRRPAGVEALRDELTRYVAGPDLDVVSAVSSDVEASRRDGA